MKGPWITRWLVTGLCPEEYAEVVLGDLDEVYQEQLKARGLVRARLRYSWFALLSVAAVLKHRVTFGLSRFSQALREGESPMTRLLQDLRIAFRSVTRRPGYGVMVVLTFALGIGSSTTVYTVVDALQDRSFPYPYSERVLWMFNEMDGQSGVGILGWSYQEALDLEQQARTIELPEPSTLASVTVTGREEPLRLQALFANSGYFELLGAQPAVGRLISQDEERVPGGHPVAVLSYETWESAFGADPSVLGTTLMLLGEAHTVVGVMEKGFVPPPSAVDIYLPAMQYANVHPRGEEIFSDRGVRFWIGNGRLAEGATEAQAREELARISQAAQEAFPDSDRGVTRGFWTLGYGYRQGAFRPLLVLLAGAGVLLLIGCLNITSLFLVRGSARMREMAVRMSLGAGRAELVGLLTSEAVLLAGIGGILGGAFAQALLPLLIRMNPTQIPQMEASVARPTVLIPVIAVTALVGLGTGLFPALRVSNVDLTGATAWGARQGSDKAGVRMREGLTVLEVATAMVLVSSAVLLVRSFQSLQDLDVGFRTQGVTTARIDLAAPAYPTREARARTVLEIQAALATVPGLEWSEVWTPGGPGDIRARQTLVKEGESVTDRSEALIAALHGVTPGALRNHEIDIVRGRGFTEADNPDNPSVVIISETLAELLWPGEDPLGRRVQQFQPPGIEIPDDQVWTVVGVAADALHTGRIPNPFWVSMVSRDAYFPLAQRSSVTMTLALASEGPVDMTLVSEAIRSVDPDVPIYEVAPQDAVFEATEAPLRFASSMMVAFAIGALVLAALGVFGVLSFIVSMRTREIGLRAALGAGRRAVLSLFLRRGVVLTLAGLTIGVVAAKALERVVVSLTSQVGTIDPFAVLGSALLLLVVALGACWIPAYRASRLAPAEVLRD